MGSIPTARVSKVANVVKWLTHQIVALTFGGSIPLIRLYFWGIASGKARDFDSLMRWFESSYPSYTLPAWRNWQTRWTQNPVSQGRAGSTPAAGIVKKTRFSDLVFFFSVFVELPIFSILK